MHRVCVRCHVSIPPDEDRAGHLCADLTKRLARRERQVQAVMSVSYLITRSQAERIVKKLSEMGVADD